MVSAATVKSCLRWKQEVESLLLYQLMVEDGPDLFSMHAFELHAPFR